MRLVQYTEETTSVPQLPPLNMHRLRPLALALLIGACTDPGGKTDDASEDSGAVGGVGGMSSSDLSSGGSNSVGGNAAGGETGSGGDGAGGMASGGMGSGGDAAGGASGGSDGSGGLLGSGGSGGIATEDWLGTWGTSPQLTEPGNNPPPPGLANNTLRQFVYVSVGGSQLRIQLSNEFGNGPVTINAAHVAAPAGSASTIDPSTDVALTFSGAPSTTLEAGETRHSDPFAFDLSEQSSVAVTIHFGAVPSEIDGHPGSRTTSYIQTGNAANAPSLSGSTTDHWYYLTRLEVMAPPPAGAVVTLGDSITDGRGSTTNGNDRWPDALARRLRANVATSKVSVINAGIGGNAVVSGGLGPTALDRFDRDVLGQAGVKWVVVLEGVNDIGGAGDATQVSNALISAYQELITKAHNAGLLIYGVPILPFGGSDYDTGSHTTARQLVNEWIRTSGSFDAVLDLDAAVEDPNNPGQLLPAYDDGDKLHLSPAGYQAMADAIDLSLFE